MNKNSLTAILVPIISKELIDLEKLFCVWSLFDIVLCESGNKRTRHIDLIITLDVENNNDISTIIEEAFNFYNLANIFSKLSIYFCAIPDQDNVYIKHGQNYTGEVPRLGLKSGPNTQFFKSINSVMQSHNTIYLNEVDCFPVVFNWLDLLSNLVADSENFWVLGSPYRGNVKIAPDIMSHINGNALYGVGLDGFEDFLNNYWYKKLLEQLQINPDTAYDVVISTESYNLTRFEQWQKTDSSEFEYYRSILCKIRHTDYIHNLAGNINVLNDKEFIVDEYLKLNASTVLMHSKNLDEYVFNHAINMIFNDKELAIKYRVKLIKIAAHLWDAGIKNFSNRLVDRLYS